MNTGKTNRNKGEENVTSLDARFSHRRGSDVISIAKKFLSPIMNPLFALTFTFTNRSSNTFTSDIKSSVV